MQEITYSSGHAISNVAMYKLTGAQAASTDPVDRSGDVITNDAYINNEPFMIFEHPMTPWAWWGYTNNQPYELAEKIEKSGVLSATIRAKSLIALGKGIAPVLITGRDPKTGQEEMEWVFDPEIEDWLELNNDYINSLESIDNVLGYGWTHSRIVMGNGHKNIASYKTDDVVKCRLGRYDPISAEIEKTYYHPWWFYVNTSTMQPKEITLLRENRELTDLQNRIAGGDRTAEYSIISRGKMNGHNYYPNAMWYSVVDWVDLVIAVPEMKKAMFANQMSIKYLISINVRYFEKGDQKWGTYTAEEKQAKFAAKVADINTHLTGNDKAYKSIAVSAYIDNDGKEHKDIAIEVLDDKVKDGKLLPESSAGDKQILFSMMFNPTILGANTFSSTGGGGGAGSGSDIREAYLVQIMLMEAERRMNSKIFNLVKRFNGWADKYPGKNLQFRYPNLLLTTLDTGGSTAPVNP